MFTTAGRALPGRDGTTPGTRRGPRAIHWPGFPGAARFPAEGPGPHD